MGNETVMGAGLALDPQTILLDTFFPGFSLLSTTIHKYFKIDPTAYIPYILLVGISAFLCQHASRYLWAFTERHLMSKADIRVDDEMFNMFMAWLIKQNFAANSRRFVANTNVNSRSWTLWYEHRHDDEEDGDEIEFENSDADTVLVAGTGKKNKMHYTPSFGNHYFWYKRHLLLFKRTQNISQSGYLPASEREEISISCFGRNPAILKQILNDCRSNFMRQDENKTLIYRGGIKSGSTEPKWTRSMSRVSRPFSTVVLDESVKKALLDDLKDYLHPRTRRWYSNRGIPYRRGYLLYGPPGTGKSSLSFAIAGYFQLKIYIVSLNSQLMNEENLGTLFSELPKQCVVLLEDIDTAGLTHTRDGDNANNKENVPAVPPAAVPGQPTPPPQQVGKLSLSALLNVIDGVASQEGRVLIMTTNHIEKLDEALIRPGRVDMMVKFNLASTEQLIQIFEGIFATIEGDYPLSRPASTIKKDSTEVKDTPVKKKAVGEKPASHQRIQHTTIEERARVSAFAKKFASIIPSDTFSPAEIQGFLLKWKREPGMAVEKASSWVEEMRAKKEAAKAKNKKKREEPKGVDEVNGVNGTNGANEVVSEKKEEDTSAVALTIEGSSLVSTPSPQFTPPPTPGMGSSEKLTGTGMETEIETETETGTTTTTTTTIDIEMNGTQDEERKGDGEGERKLPTTDGTGEKCTWLWTGTTFEFDSSIDPDRKGG